MAVVTSTVLAVAAVASAAAAGIGAYSSYEQSQSQARIQRRNAEIQAQYAQREADINASNLQTQRNQAEALDRQQAATLAAAAETRKRLIQEKLRLQGAQTAAAAKGGVVMAGTPLEFLADTEFEYDRKTNDVTTSANWEANSLYQEAALRRKGFETEAANISMRRSSAKAQREIAYQSASATERRGTYGAAGTLLSGIGSTAGYYGDYQKALKAS